MSFLKKLFGLGAAPKSEPEIYRDYRIFPEPINEGSSFRVAARIEKEIDGDIKNHQMIRADTYATQDMALDATLTKAKQLIDQQGDTIFGAPRGA